MSHIGVQSILEGLPMPIYAYRCRDCGKAFQTLVMSGETPVCEACDSADLEQQLSLIAEPSRGGESGPSMAACDAMGGCGCAGMCPAMADA
jgi:putative FmdB family regulatory protein